MTAPRVITLSGCEDAVIVENNQGLTTVDRCLCWSVRTWGIWRKANLSAEFNYFLGYMCLFFVKSSIQRQDSLDFQKDFTHILYCRNPFGLLHCCLLLNPKALHHPHKLSFTGFHHFLI